MATHSWQISRRHVLRGMGATMGLPLLEAMLPSGRALAAGAAGHEGQPVRFADTLQHIRSDGPWRFIELSPHPPKPPPGSR